MPTPRTIPPIDIKQYAKQGPVYFKSHPPHVAIEMHYCTAMMNREQTLEAMVSLLKAGNRTWGDSFKLDVQTILEGM